MNTSGAVKIVKKRHKRPFNVFRLFEWSATVLLFIVVILIIIGFFPVSHPWITGKWVDLLRKNGADSYSIDNVSIVLWRRIEFTNVKVGKIISDRERYTCSFGKVLVSVNLVTAILKAKQVEGLLHDYQNDLLYDMYKRPGNRLRDAVRYLNFHKGIKGVVFENLSFDVQWYDSASIRLRNGLLSAFHDSERELLDIKYQFGHFNYDSLSVQDNRGTISLDERFIRIIRARGNYGTGKYRASGDIDLHLSRLESGQLTVNEINLASLAQFCDPATGTISGDMDGEIRFESAPFIIDSLQGSGEMELRNLYVSNIQLQRVIGEMLAVPQLDTLQFDKVKNNFTMKRNLTFFNETHGVGRSLSFTAKGWITLDGALNQEIQGNISESLVKQLPPLVANSMEAGEKGDRLFRCRVYGQYSTPRVELDPVILKRAVGNMFKDMRDNLKSLFRKKQFAE